MKRLFITDLYIKIRENRLEAKNLSDNGGWKTLCPEQTFTTERLLVGTFSVAEPALTQLVKSVTQDGFLRRAPRMIIQPMALVDGGLSEVEERILKELALGAGASKVVIHVGLELTDDEAAQLLQNA